TGGTGTGYAWTVSSGSLPAGITLSSSGLLSGKGTATSAVSFTVKVTDSASDAATQVLTLAINNPLNITTAGTLPSGITGKAYSTSFSAAGGALGGYTFSLGSGTLPPGLTLTTNTTTTPPTGLLSGNPSAAGAYSFSVAANDGVSPAATLAASVTIYQKLLITTAFLPNGTVGTAYGPVTMASSGGSGSVTWSATLPAGLSIGPATGVISGTPTAAGTSNASITATDSTSSQTATATLSVTVVTATASLAVSPTTLVLGAATGAAVSGSFTPSGGTPPYTFTVSSGTLPSGITLSNAGAISGSTATPGNTTVTVKLADSQSGSTTAQLTIKILGFTTTKLPAGAATVPYLATVNATGGTPPYAFSATGLPAGFSLSGGGTLAGTAATPGTVSFTAQVTDAVGITATQAYSVTIQTAPLSIPAPSLPNGTAGTAYSQILTATGGVSPYKWATIGGNLPPGLSLSSSGTISGNPTTPGTYSVSVQATDSTGGTASAMVGIVIQPQPLTITTGALPGGVVGFSYPQQILSASGGVSPYAFAIASGALPNGLTLTSGVISGTPTAPGTFPVVVTVTDSASKTASATLTITVAPPSSNLVLQSASVSFSIVSGATTTPPPQTVGVQATGNQAINYSVSVNPPAPWLNSIPNGTTPSTLSFSLNSQAASQTIGVTQTQVTLTCNTGSCAGSSQNVNVYLTVSSPPPALNVLTSLLAFSSSTTPPQAQTMQVAFGNSGGGTLNITSVSCESSWCTVGTPPSSLTGGAAALVNVTADPSTLSNGFYQTALDIVTSAGSASVPVTFFISQTANMTFSPTGAVFTMPQGGAPGNPSGSFQIAVTSGTSNWTAALFPPASYITLSNTSGTATPSQPGVVNFSINGKAAGLAAGTYYATIRVNATSVVDPLLLFELVLNVTPANVSASIQPSPGGLVFLTQVGGSPAPQTVTVYSTSSASTTYYASAIANPTITNTGTWLGVAQSSGSTSSSTPGQTTVTVNTAGLTQGIYKGSVALSLAGVSGVQSVAVALVVQPTSGGAAGKESTGLPASGTNASCAPTTLVPIETGLATNFSVPALWPAPLSVLLVNDCGSLVNGAQVQATFSDGDSPLTLSQVAGSAGLYSGTWMPQNPAAQVTVTAQASVTGLPAATVQVSGAVTPNTAPSLAANATALVYNPKVGGALAPGSIVSIAGANLASAAVQASTAPLPVVLGNTSVTIGGVQAPLYYASPSQILAEVPFELTAGQQYPVVVSNNGALTASQTVQISTVSPGLAVGGDGTVIAQHWDDGSLVSASDPAVPGEYVVLYLVGMGSVDNSVATGAAASASPLSRVTSQPTVTMGGTSIPVLFAGLTPDSVGLYQIDIQMPSTLAGGNQVLTVSQGTAVSNTTILPTHN
ncbi:MAG TPA: putative Ig domain-containing protein, partial [Bryobacteraceae bacterium]|nr:putative Ig domain-containing protein [Bryobacteraceae bacterium]